MANGTDPGFAIFGTCIIGVIIAFAILITSPFLFVMICILIGILGGATFVKKI